MTLKHILSAGFLLALATVVLTTPIEAAVQSSENFDTGWPGVPWTDYTSNATNSTTKWAVTDISIDNSYGSRSPSYAAVFFSSVSGSTCVRSPWLTNGIGSVRFWVKNVSSGKQIAIAVESSFQANMTAWVTNSVVTNTSQSFTSFTITNLINPSTNQAIRLRKLSSAPSGNVIVMDDIEIAYPPGSVSVANVVRSPPAPGPGQPVTINATVAFNGMVDSLGLTNYWRQWPDTNWTAIAMTSNSATSFTTASNIPGRTVGAIMEYFVEAAYSAGGATYSTNSPIDFYTVTQPSGFSNIAVSGAVNANLILVENSSWQGVVSVTNLTDGVIRFEGLSNGVTTTWGDANQTVTSMPTYGAADIGATGIVLYGANSGFLVISFNETNYAYSVQPCAYTDFESWNVGPFGNATNAGWTIGNGRVTNDTTRPLRGNAAVLNGSPDSGSNSVLSAPLLTNGIGQISFWYRNWESNASLAASLLVQVAPSDTSSNWTTIATLANILSPNYLHCGLERSDRNNRGFRIVNNPAGGAARICLDEIVVAEPGAGVVFSDLGHSPSVPVCTNPVAISVSITPMANASISNVTLYYRAGASGPFSNTLTMTNTGSNRYEAVIPAGQGPDTGAGLVQYYVSCDFGGFGSAAVSPACTPTAGSGGPTNFTISRSYLTLSNVSLVPDTPRAGTNIQIVADVAPGDGASNIVASAFYRVGGSGAFSNVPLVYSGSANRYVTTNTISVGALPGVPIYYFVTANCQGGNPIAPTNYPAQGTNAPLVAVVRTTPFLSSYSNLLVSGSFVTNLLLTGNYTWQGVATLSNAVDATFQFVGISGATNYWGLPAQSMSNFPYYGTAVSDTSAIKLFGTNTGHFVFEFNETNGAFLVRRCAYLNFEDWTNASPYGIYTNSEGWVLTDGRTTTNAPADDLLRFSGAGRSGILREGPSTNAALATPLLSGGMGRISFWYRSAETNATRAAGFRVQTAASLTSAWTTVATFTNIFSQDYLYASIPYGSRDAHCMRILNDTNASHAALSLDEIVVSELGSDVQLTSLSHSPTTPTCTNPVAVAVNITPLGSAAITNVTLTYRSTVTTGTVTMANSASNLFTGTIPPGQGPNTGAGLVQYYVTCAFSGYDSESVSPVSAPLAGAAGPTNYTVTRSYLSITNVSLVPTPPLVNSAIQVAADITPYDGASNITATAFYRVGATGAFSSISMVYAGASNRFVTTNGIPPVSAPNTPIYYAVSATCQGGNPIVPTNYPPSGTNSPLVAYTVRASTYSNVQVTGSFSTNLILVDNYTWQGVVTLSNAVNATFQFAGISGSTSYWGITSQAISNYPYFGVAELGATNMTLFGTNTGHFAFDFNDSTGSFLIRRCAYLNFNDWTNASPTNTAAYGIYTNNEGWILAGRTTTNSTSDNLLRFQGTGRSGILATNGYVLSPSLSSGIGAISFWYRNAQTNPTTPVQFSVQSSANPASSWFTIANYTNVLSSEYIYVSLPYGDTGKRFVRILNDAASNATVCIDEIVIAAPLTWVTPSNLTNTPAVAGFDVQAVKVDDVNIGVDLSPNFGATVTNAVAWFRLGSFGAYSSLPMTNSGTRWTTAAPLGQTNDVPFFGTVQYYIQYFFAGSQSYGSPACYPSDITNAPASFVVTHRSETFDVGWAGAPWTEYTSSATNPLTAWSVADISIDDSYGASSPRLAGVFFSADSSVRWLRSPWLTNAIGAVTFSAANVNSNRTIAISVESCFDTNASTWVTNTIVSSASQSFTQFIVTNLLAATSNQFIRLRKQTSGPSGYSLIIDDIIITYPPSDVVISNVFTSPGYPSSNNTVRVSCEVYSVNPQFPAYNFSPTLYYRRSTDSAFSNCPMHYVSGNRYETYDALPIPAQARDVKVEYFIRCDFGGYHGTVAENRSPRFYPAGGSNSPANYIVRAFASPYGTVSAIVNGRAATNNVQRMIDNHVWQSIVNLSGTTNRFSLSLQGSGYSSGNGYSTSTVTWGNSTNWQTVLPLADTAGIGQSNVVITGGPFSGQYVVRFDEVSGDYTVQECVWQDFDSWLGSASNYFRDGNASIPNVQCNFDAWATNTTRVRGVETFDTGWRTNYYSTATNCLVCTNANWPYQYTVYGSQITPLSSNSANYVVQTQPGQLSPLTKHGWVAQMSYLPEQTAPLRGIETISFSYRATQLSPTCTVGVYFFPTNLYTDMSSFANNAFSWSLITNDTRVCDTNIFSSMVLTIKTNTTFDVLFSHDSGDQSVYFDNISVSEWYADTLTNDSWYMREGWIESRGVSNNSCRFDITRSDSTNQFLQSPLLTNGIHAFTFWVYGTGSTSASFSVQSSPDLSTWTPLTNASFSTVGMTNYVQFGPVFMDTNTPMGIRIVNTTPAPGSLLIDDVAVSPFVQGVSWVVNNAAIANMNAQNNPPFARQFYVNPCYLNSNRFAVAGSPVPETNSPPYVQSPMLASGIGEISFWYRNWASEDPVIPATLRFQVSADSANWTTLGSVVCSNIVYTNDYLYFRASIYDTNSHYVRIYNDDTITTAVGRVCLDDILVTAPLASTLSMSNLVVDPPVPLYSNEVNVSVDLYGLFYNPSVAGVQVQYGSAASYTGLTSSVTSSIPMVCIDTNPTVPGKWYRYKTAYPIPAKDADTFVRYQATATFTGYHSEVTSPKLHTSFASQPKWYDPIKDYTNNVAYYIVFSCPTGAVWINELNAVDGVIYGDYEKYVELCGVNGVNLSNWTLQILSRLGATQDTYQIGNYPIPSVTNGFGFWVIGDSNTLTRNADLTNGLPTEGGIRLLRPLGICADRVAYGEEASVGALTAMGFKYIGADDAFVWSDPLAAMGSGNEGGAFTNWQAAPSFTPGEINPDQYLTGQQPELPPPTIAILAFGIANTNVWIRCNTTNNWYPAPWYTTNLMSSGTWTNMLFTRTMTSSNATLNFLKVASPAIFYKVVATNAP